MKNRQKRIEILSNGTYQSYTEKRKKAFLAGHPGECYKDIIDNDTGEILATELNEEYFQIDKDDLKECERVRKCRKEQREKIEAHIKFLFEKSNYRIFFITFNFTDEALELTPDTRKQKIRRLLNMTSDDYILNIDFGKTTDREHYHAVVAFKINSFTEYRNEFGKLKIQELDSYDFGFYDVEEIRTSDLDMKRLSRYITKLTMHSVKVRQSYVSVKKGTDYQAQKKTIKALKIDARRDRLFKPDYNDILFANSL